MPIFPPSGVDENQLDGTDPKWTRWFAWYPVKVEPYIRDGRRRSKIWMEWVECRLRPDGPQPDDMPVMQYRLPRRF